MANLPETLFVDPTAAALDGGGGADSYAPKPAPMNLRSATVEQLISSLGEPQYREDALYILTKVALMDQLALCMSMAHHYHIAFAFMHEEKQRVGSAIVEFFQYNLYTAAGMEGVEKRHLLRIAVEQSNISPEASTCLEFEVMSLYKLLSPPKLTMAESTRVCNALALFQCIASHPDTRMGLVRAKIPVYLYPFVKSTDKQRPSEFLKLTSLGVISALVKVEDTNTPQVIHFLLETEVFPLCLGCMEQGNELTQTVATYIISKILMQREAIRYCALFAERFFSVGCLLASMVKHIISCFLSLAEVPRLVGCHDALERCFPARLSDPQFIRVAYGGPSTKHMLEVLLCNVHAGLGLDQNQLERYEEQLVDARQPCVFIYIKLFT